MQSEKLNVVDVFCGAGGMSEGFRMAGFDILLGIENNLIAADTFSHNNPGASVIIKDIKKVSKDDILEKTKGRRIHVVVGGPPCQGFSNANRRKKINDRRNTLYREFLRIVNYLKPDFFVIENVRGILSWRNLHILKDIKKQVGSGYSITSKVLLATNYGVPQARHRAFIIGRKGSEPFKFPSETHSLTTNGNGLNRWVSVRNCLLPKDKVNEALFYSKRLIKGFKRRERNNKKRKIGFKWQFLDLDKPSYTIPARYYKDGANALVKYSNSKIRMLDTNECARIQSFPENFVFTGSRKEIYKQIGNAVPPLLAHAVGKEILKNLGFGADE